MRNRVYSIREVETLLGIPRTKIRHYLDKSLIDVKRDEENGYYMYQLDDLVRISQVVYYREVLGYSIEETAEMLDAGTVHKAMHLAESRADSLRSIIDRSSQQLKLLEFNGKLIERQHTYRDRFALVPFDTMYSLPYAYFIMTDHPLWPIMFGVSEFSFDGEELHHERLRCGVFKHDLQYLPRENFEKCQREAEVIERNMAVYTVKMTDANVRDPEVLWPAIHWATRHRFRINGPIFMVWFYPFYRGDSLERYVEILLPIDVF